MVEKDGYYYATNNPYQLNGPKGFTEFRYMEETTDMFVRLDFPGIIKGSVKILIEPSKKAVIVIGDAPKEHRHDSSGRKYGAATGLVCDCCEISNVQCFVGEGVVRLILSKKKIINSSCCNLFSFFLSFLKIIIISTKMDVIYLTFSQLEKIQEWLMQLLTFLFLVRLVAFNIPRLLFFFFINVFSNFIFSDN